MSDKPLSDPPSDQPSAQTLNPESVLTQGAQTPLEAPPTTEPEAVAVVSQWRLTWWRFKKHKLALVGGVVTLLIYGVAVFAQFLAPALPGTYNPLYTYAPPQPIRLFNRTVESGWRFFPHVNGYKSEVDPVALRRTFVLDPESRIPIGLFVEGEPYRFLNLIPTNRHLIGSSEPSTPVYFLGADRLGRDMASRILYGTRVSLSIGLIGVALSFVLGILLGGVSGYIGGWVDTLIQRVIEFLEAIPTIPLWMGLAAAIPLTMPPLQVYFFITLILSIIGWTGLARVVRGKFYALKTEDFVTAAKLDGCGDLRIIWRHMLPSFSSHIIAAVTLAIPGVILGETALSFLGIGLRAPVVSWGVLLSDAQNVRAVAAAPWLLWPGAAVVVAVLALNFLGDGLRDAADPYA